MTTNLDHLIPPASFKDGYISRYFDGFQDLDLLEYAHGAMKHVLLFGPTGPGKTSMLYAYAAWKQIPIATIQCNGGADIHACFGGPVMDEDKKIRYVEADPVSVVRQGGILYFDELNFLPPRHTAVFHGLFDFRRELILQDKQNEAVKASDDLFICASFNPGYEGTRPLNQALANRFEVKLECDYDKDIETELITKMDAVPTSLLAIANSIRSQGGGTAFSSPVSTNMLVEFVEHAQDLTLKFAIMNFVNAFDSEERNAVRELFSIYGDELAAEMSAS